MLVAFEGINGVGKTHCLNTFRHILEDKYGVKSEVITSKPSIQEMKESGLYEVIANPCDVTDKEKRDIASLFYKKQHQLGVEYSDLIDSHDSVAIADRWLPSTVVYSIYYDFLKEDRKNDIEDLEKYCSYIKSGNVDDVDISLMLRVKTQFKDIVRKFIDTLTLVNGFKPVIADLLVYVISPDVDELLKNRNDDKLVTRWEKEDISKLLENIYVVVNEVLIDLGYCKNILTIENRIMEDGKAYVTSLEKQFAPIYDNFFRKELEVDQVDESSCSEVVEEENKEETVAVVNEEDTQNVEEKSDDVQQENNEDLFLDANQPISLSMDSNGENSVPNLTMEENVNLEITSMQKEVPSEESEEKEEQSNNSDVIRDAFSYKPRTNNDQQNYRDGKKNGKWNQNYKNYRR